METIKSTLILLPGEPGIIEGANQNVASIVPTSSVLSVDGKFKKAFNFTGQNIESNCMQIINGMTGIDFSKDFTIDWWEMSTGSSAVSSCVFDSRIQKQLDHSGIVVAGFGNLIHAGTDTPVWNIINDEIFKDKIYNTWVHWALTKSDNVWTSYKNGIKFWTISSNMTPSRPDGDNFTLCGRMYSPIYNGYNALIENFRISNIALWTTDFTPPESIVDYYIVNTIEIKNVLFSQTNIKDNSGNLFITFDPIELDYNLLKKQSNYKVELNGQIVSSGVTIIDVTTSVSIPKIAFVLGNNAVKITVSDILYPATNSSFEYNIIKEDRDTFSYIRRFEHDSSTQLIEKAYIKPGEGIGITDKIGTGYVALEIPTEGKASINNISVNNASYLKSVIILKEIPMTFKENIGSEKVYEIPINSISDIIKKMNIIESR